MATEKTRRLIQIVNGEMRDIEENDGDVTAVPPGSEIIFPETIDAILKMKHESGENKFNIEEAVIADRGLQDKRKEKEERTAQGRRTVR